MLKIGIIGSGFGTIGLLPAFKSTKGCRVVGVASKRSEWPLLLARTDIDAVAIAVPPNVQYRIAKAAIAKGLHVFAEKPLAANIREARELLSMSRKKRIVHGIDFMFPEIAEWKKVKQILDSKKLGALKHVSVRWSWLSGDIKYNRTSWKTDRAVGGGMLSFYFSHGLNYLEHFVGSIIDADYVSTHLSKRQGGTESGFDMLLRFQNGVRGNVHLSRNSPGRVEHQLIFECEKGILTLENKNAVVDNFLVTIHSQVGMNHISVKKDKGRDGEDERVKIVRKLAKRFVDACIQRKQMHPSFEEGLRVEELIEQILPKNKQDHF